MNVTQPRFPIYIPSKSRHEVTLTANALDTLGVPYRVVVEEPQLEQYRTRFGEEQLLVLDPQYQAEYDTCDDLGDTKSKGPGPARNFIWEHSMSEGHSHHWVMDDNIRGFFRFTDNEKLHFGDGSGFHAMEEFVLRYRNVAMAGPHYEMFVPARESRPPFMINTRIYSCNLIRNDVPFRWRARYNEDTDLSLRMLKRGWVTIQFVTFLQQKIATQRVAGGNTEAFYAAEGTLPKSEMLVRLHPDVAKLVWKYGRWHHQVDYSSFTTRPIRDETAPPPDPTKYRMRKVPRDRRTGRTLR